MLKCPVCGRTGGPFRLRHQIQADGQTLRDWLCPCGSGFHATGGAERTASPQQTYTGFAVEWSGRTQPVRLQHMTKHESVWTMGAWTVTVAGPPGGPGTRVVTVADSGENPVGEWRLEPSWGPLEITRRLRATPLPTDLDPELLARIFVRLMN